MSKHSKKPVCSKVEELLASLELGRPRTPDELLAVAAEIDRVLGESEELRIMSCPPRLWKKYIEEVRPLTHLARGLFPGRQDVLCQPNLSDSGNYDAIITFTFEKAPKKLLVEFTYAKDGHEDSLRMKVLNKKVRVNLLVQPRHGGTKNTGHHIEIPDEVVLKSHTLEKHRCLIVGRIKAKANKKYGPEHILVVVFDDLVSFRTDQEMADLKSYVASEICLLALEFRSLYLLGSSGKVLSELRL